MSILHSKDWTIVTGASRGIGKAVALRLAASNFNLILIARNDSLLSELSAQIHRAGGSALWFKADLTNENDLNLFGDWLRTKNLQVKHIVLNAGLALIGKVLEMPIQDWRAIFETNVLAPVALLQTVKENLQNNGHLIFINSVAGKVTFPDWGAYSASKFALKAITSTLRQELADKKIHVTSVFPSSVATSLHDQLGLQWDKSRMLKTEDLARAVEWLLQNPEHVNINELSMENIHGLF